MDNTAKGFAQKIVSELEGIKGLIIDSISGPLQERDGTQENTEKSAELTDKQKESATAALPSIKTSEVQPAIAATRNTPTENKVRFPRLTQWKPIIELGGVIFLVIYTGVTILLWCSSREANRISQANAQTQNRAYLGVEPALIENFNPGDATTITFQIENFGQTPAYAVKPYSHAEVLPYPLPPHDPFPFAPPAGTQFESVSSIYPHHPVPTGVKMDHALKAEEAKAILEGTTSRLYTGGQVRYRDIFGVERCTRFLVSVGGQELADWMANVKAGKVSGFPWRWSNLYNDDDQCDKK